MIPAILLTVNPHLDVVFKNGKVPIWYDHFHKNSQAQRWGKTKSIWWWCRWKRLATKEGIENCAENTSAKNWQKCRPKNGETEELTVLMKAFGLGQSEEKNRPSGQVSGLDLFLSKYFQPKIWADLCKTADSGMAAGDKNGLCCAAPTYPLYIQHKITFNQPKAGMFLSLRVGFY